MGADCCVKENESQVGGEVNRQKNLLADLRKIVDTLDSRLASIMRDNTPQPETASQDRASLVPLATEISSCNDEILVAYQGLSSILDRLEL